MKFFKYTFNIKHKKNIFFLVLDLKSKILYLKLFFDRSLLRVKHTT